ncbi:flavodoxin family protein [Gordonia sp. DT30]|uniref:flavodoxin family protein n=1 Tax=unclassified Gordonia (in: high G+C Gram-positive bacteria) TaxID=2657482 RepID=UPI003CEA923B
MTDTLLVCVSRSHGNTRCVAEAMASVLGAEVVDPGEVDAGRLAEVDLIGFGSGIYNQRFDSRLRDFIDAVPPGNAGACAFVFYTSGFRPITGPLTRRIERHGRSVVGTFGCRGWDTSPPFGLAGGLRRGRPDDRDLERARQFAADLSPV